MLRSLARAGAVGLLAAVAACTPPVDTEFYSRVLILEDGRSADPGAWRHLYRLAPDVPARARVVRAAGRVRAPDLVPVLEEWWSGDPPVPVVDEILFALGQSGTTTPRPLLRQALVAPRAGVRARAAEALGKIGDTTDVAVLLPLLQDGDGRVRSAALLALVRIRGRRAAPEESLAAAERETLFGRLVDLLEDDDGEVRWQAAYALAEIELPGRLDVLANLARSIDTRARLFSVRAISRLEGDAPRRRAILEEVLETDTNVHAAAAAADGLARLAGGESFDVLLRATTRQSRPADHHVRQAALAALGRIPLPGPGGTGPLRETLARALDDPSSRVRAAALETQAVHFPDEARALLESWSARADSLARAAAARAASRLPRATAVPLLAPLFDDPVPAVAAAALDALASVPQAGEAARQAALSVLSRPDLAVRGTALAVLERTGRPEDVPAIVASLRNANGSDWIEVRVAAVRAAAALSPEAAEPFLREALGDPATAVRRQAASRLGEKPAVPSPAAGEDRASSSTARPGIDFLARGDNPHAWLDTTRGRIELELLPDEAPRHVRSFLERARAGLYDGLPFHRVVSGFVVQGLDPRGDGWGSGGVFLRDEINPVPYRAGSVGMPNAGPDSAGCQIFITHVPTPHLDGSYTVFGRVVTGMEVVDALDVGDVCRRVTVRL